MRPLILVTNDDGIESPGLHAAIAALYDLGDLIVIAPTTQQSGMSRSLSARFDGRIFSLRLAYNGLQVDAFHLDGTPAQTVLYGVEEVAPRMAGRLPDLVVSGINYGENLGSQTMISGTVGAALQGGDMGIRSLAVSLETSMDYHMHHGEDVDWSGAAYWLAWFARQALAPFAWPTDVAVLKIDVPEGSTPQTPWRLTSQSNQVYYRSIPTRTGSLDEPVPLDYAVFIDHERLEPASDIHAFAVDRIVSVTPLSANLTARVSLPDFDALLRQAAKG